MTNAATITTVYYVQTNRITGRAQVVGASSALGAEYLASCANAAPAGARRLFADWREAEQVAELLEDIRIFGEF